MRYFTLHLLPLGPALADAMTENNCSASSWTKVPIYQGSQILTLDLQMRLYTLPHSAREEREVTLLMLEVNM
jgi:hypothetical protein